MHMSGGALAADFAVHSTMCTPNSQESLPGTRHTAVTASEDGTLRVWDTTTVGQRTVVKPSVDRPGRVPVTACAYGDEGALLAAGLASGTIQLWDIKGVRTCKCLQQASCTCPV